MSVIYVFKLFSGVQGKCRKISEWKVKKDLKAQGKVVRGDNRTRDIAPVRVNWFQGKWRIYFLLSMVSGWLTTFQQLAPCLQSYLQQIFFKKDLQKGEYCFCTGPGQDQGSDPHPELLFLLQFTLLTLLGGGELQVMVLPVACKHRELCQVIWELGGILPPDPLPSHKITLTLGSVRISKKSVSETLNETNDSLQ